MSTAMNSVEENLRLMKTLDDAWNTQDWDTFDSRHAENVVVYWPGQPEPTRGGLAHRAESIEFFKTYPDNHIDNDPYKVLFGQGEWTCSVARFTSTMKGPMKGPDGTMIAPTNKRFEVEFCTVAHWQNGKIVEERLFYDLVGLMRQIDVG
jgi:ketosteroid isomerase-like protein